MQLILLISGLFLAYFWLISGLFLVYFWHFCSAANSACFWFSFGMSALRFILLISGLFLIGFLLCSLCLLFPLDVVLLICECYCLSCSCHVMFCQKRIVFLIVTRFSFPKICFSSYIYELVAFQLTLNDRCLFPKNFGLGCLSQK